jgi:hypothetical protein
MALEQPRKAAHVLVAHLLRQRFARVGALRD